MQGGHSSFRYALIGLVPHSFHFDLSKGFIYKSCMLPYAIAFNDVHNFYLPIDVYKKFFREEWLTTKLPLKSLNVELPYTDLLMKTMDQKAINANTVTWNGKYYPETRDENIKILDDYLTLCEENNICPVMFRVPMTEKYMKNFNAQLNEEFLALVEQALSKHLSARFFDGWKLQGFTYADFYDHSHLNFRGAAKFSSLLNDYIEELDFNSIFYNHWKDFAEELDRSLYNHLE